MYRPTKYNDHNESLAKFANIFNTTRMYQDIQMIGFDDENFSDDGYIMIADKNKKIYYDWEKRDRYFSNGKFAFKTLGQFERKFHKNPPIGISLQCDSSEEYVLVALHSGFSEKKVVSRITDTINEVGGMRETSHFYIFSYLELDKLKEKIIDWIEQGKTDFIDIK